MRRDIKVLVTKTRYTVDHYKLLSVHEQPLGNQQNYLDVLCFTMLFPTGMYGEFHPCDVKISFSEYLKSRLLNSNGRFRKNAEFVLLHVAEGAT